MTAFSFEASVNQILAKETRFEAGAYFLVREALDFTIDRIAKESDGENRHVTGKELLLGFRDYTLREYGPMSATLLHDWGLEECRHVGEIVFLFIEEGIFGKQDSDTLEDFCDVFDFQEAFTEPFKVAS